MILSVGSKAQCYIKSNDEGGYITYYMEPELVAQTSEFGMALSVQMISDKYYLAVTYQFGGASQPVEEKIALNLKNGYSLELDMYTMEVGSAGNVELCMAVFHLEETQMNYFTKSPLSTVKFKTQDGKSHTLTVTSSNDVLVRQLKCFRK